jgi:hypothetical protein
VSIYGLGSVLAEQWEEIDGLLLLGGRKHGLSRMTMRQALNVVEAKLMALQPDYESRERMRGLIRGESPTSSAIEDVNAIRAAMGARGVEDGGLILHSIGAAQTGAPAGAAEDQVAAALAARESMKSGGPIVL